MYFDSSRGLVLVLLDAEEGTTLRRIKTPCGVVIAPASPAQVILTEDDSHLKLVYDAVYGSLPDNTLVVAVKNGSGTFPEDAMALKVRVILDPYQSKCDSPEVIDPSLAAWGGGCPVCGDLEPGDVEDLFDADDDDDGDDGDEGSDDDGPPDDDEGNEDWTPGEDDPPVGLPLPRRFTLEMLEPSQN